MSLPDPTDAERRIISGFGKLAADVASEAPFRRFGRPSVYSPSVAEVILHRLAEGDSLLSICREHGMPSESTVRGWALDDRDGFAARYDRARELQADKHADDTIAISDGRDLAPGEVYDAAKARVQVAARQWHAGRIRPRKWGDRIQVDVPSNPLATTVSDDLAQQLAAIERELLDAARRGSRLSIDRGAADDTSGDLEAGGGE